MGSEEQKSSTQDRPRQEETPFPSSFPTPHAIPARSSRLWIGGAVLFATAFAAHMWFTIGGDLTNLRNNHIDAFCHLPWMYRWAKTRLADTPKDTRVAALPDQEAYPLPMLAKRSLLITPAALFPYHCDFRKEMVARLEAILNAVYATDWQVVHRLRDQYHARFLIVDRSLFDPVHFAERAGGNHARPILPQRVESIRDRGPNRPYLFRHAPRDAVAVEVGNYQMIDLERIP